MKNKTDNFEKYDTRVVFFRVGKKYYFVFNDNKYEFNNITINKLKEQLILPYKVEFFGLSKAQVGKVLSILLDNTMEAKFKKVRNDVNNVLKFEAIFFEKAREIEVYKMSNISCLYGRVNNCNPYIFTKVLNKDVLLEVSRDYVKNNEVEYYFLASDLSSDEREIFDSCYRKINCDFVYDLNNDLENIKSNVFQKKLCKRSKLNN